MMNYSNLRQVNGSFFFNRTTSFCLYFLLLSSCLFAQKTWTGAIDNDWNNTDNWSPVGVPTTADDIIIPDVANDPALIGSGLFIASGRTMTVEAGAVWTIDGQNTVSAGLDISGTLTNHGEIYIHTFQGNGIYANGTLTNHGIIDVSDVSSNGIINYSTITNENQLFIDNTGIEGMANIGTITNTSCATIITTEFIADFVNDFTNDGFIIESSADNSDVEINNGIIYNLNGGTFNVTTGNAPLTSLPATYTWTGATDTDWEEPCNWDSGIVPDGDQHVVIPDVANDPVANGIQIVVGTGKLLTIEAGGILTIDGQNAIGYGMSNLGTVENNGNVNIRNTTAGGFMGSGVWNNNNLLSIDDTGGYGIYNSAGTINNEGVININNTASIGILDLGVTNNNGEININDTGDHGIHNHSGSFTNNGTINIGNTANLSLSNLGTFTNSACAYIYVISQIYIAGSGFVNNGVIVEDFSGYSFLQTNNGVVYNLGGGTFPIPNGIAPLTILPTDFTWTGVEDSDWNNSCNWFGGTVPGISDDIVIPTAVNAPIVIGSSVNISSGTNFTILEGGGLTIDVQSLADFGIDNSGSLTNQGIIHISNAANDGITNAGSITNFGFIDLNGNVTNGIYNVGTFLNENCALIQTTDFIEDAVNNFTNNGSIIEYSPDDSNIETNNGIIYNLNGGSFNVASGIAPLTALPATYTWTGCVSTDWNSPSNWDSGSVPDGNQNVVIPNVDNDPMVAGDSIFLATGYNMTLETGAVLTVDRQNTNGNCLFILGTLTNHGAINLLNAQRHGIYLNGTLINHGLIDISNVSANGIIVYQTLNNEGKIVIENTGLEGIANNGTITNTNCAFIQSSNFIADFNNDFTNQGTIVESSPDNSDIETNNGIIYNLNGGSFNVATGNAPLTSIPTTYTWTGATDNDWKKACNWDGGVVPDGNQDVVIPSVANDPVANDAKITLATGKTLVVNMGASLTVNGNGSTNHIDGDYGIDNDGTITIWGELSINDFAHDGINNKSEVNIYGVLEIEDIYFSAIAMRQSSTFTFHSGSRCYLENLRWGIWNNNGTVVNMGEIIGHRFEMDGIENNGGGSFTNNDEITFSLFGRSGIRNTGVGSTFTNTDLLDLNLAGGDTDGIYNSEGTFTNSNGNIVIDEVGRDGIQNTSGGIFNNEGGTITISNTNANAIANLDNGSVFNNSNSGLLNLSVTGANGNGIFTSGIFNNQTDGEITISDIGLDGIQVANGSFLNDGGTINISDTDRIFIHQFGGMSTFTNTNNGVINSSNGRFYGVYISDGVFTNSSSTLMASNTSSANVILVNASSFINTNNGTVHLNDGSFGFFLQGALTNNAGGQINMANHPNRGMTISTGGSFNNGDCAAFIGDGTIEVLAGQTLTNTGYIEVGKISPIGTFNNTNGFVHETIGVFDCTANGGTCLPFPLTLAEFQADVNMNGTSLCEGDLDDLVCPNQTTHFVINSLDDGLGSLRYAIDCASAGDTITFSVATDNTPIQLTTGQIIIDKNLTFQGRSCDSTIIDGSLDDANRLFEVQAGIELVLADLQLQNGGGANFINGGGAILNNGSIKTIRCKFMGNQAENGGVIQNTTSGNIKAVNCFFENNETSLEGGAIGNNGNARFTNCLFANNQGGEIGGAIITIDNGTDNYLDLTNCTMTKNEADEGGGLAYNSKLYLSSSIIAQNIATTSGPDIMMYAMPNNLIYFNLIGDPTDSGITIGTNWNISGDPLFVDAVNNDFHLQFNSPCRNEGSKGFLLSDYCDVDRDGNLYEQVDIDLDGNFRTMEGLTDMGAFESCFLPANTILYVDVDAIGEYLGTSWEDAFNSLENALKIATCTDQDVQIWVAEGTYKPTQVWDGDQNSGYDPREKTFVIPDKAQLYGGFAGGETSLSDRDWEAHPTILSGDIDNNDLQSPAETATDIQGENAYHVLVASFVTETTILDGFTVTGGLADANIVPQVFGAGLLHQGNGAGMSSTMDIANCIFSGNKTLGRGGAIYNRCINEGHIDMDVTNSTFTGNMAGLGGAISIAANSGGLYTGTISHCKFLNNTSSALGGALGNTASSNGLSNPKIVHCFFKDNTAVRGGGIYNNGRDGQSSPIITNSQFINNSSSILGGGIYNLGSDMGESSPLIYNSLFAGNSAPSGGAIYNNGNAESNSGANSSPTITNCTFYNNSASANGAALYNTAFSNGNSSPQISNSIFWNNIASGGSHTLYNDLGTEQIGTAEPVLTNCLVQENDCPNENNGGNTTCNGTMIYNTDPLFADAANGHYQLMGSSPAINMGDNTLLPADTCDLDGDGDKMEAMPIDLGGYGRIQFSDVDMGAYEMSSDSCTVALSLACGEVVTGNTVGTSTQSALTCPLPLETAGGVWFKITGTGGVITLSSDGSDFNTQLAVSKGGCNLLECVVGNDDFNAPQSQVSIGTEIGAEYYIYLTGYGTETGHFQLSATCGAACPFDLNLDNSLGDFGGEFRAENTILLQNNANVQNGYEAVLSAPVIDLLPIGGVLLGGLLETNSVGCTN